MAAKPTPVRVRLIVARAMWLAAATAAPPPVPTACATSSARRVMAIVTETYRTAVLLPEHTRCHSICAILFL